MLDRFRRRETLRSFDYQWRELPEGKAVLSDPWFRENVDRILVEELLSIDPGWFRGRTVLDAGCGGGRWTLGFLRLGAAVLAVDWSAAALELTRSEMKRWAPEPVAAGRLSVERVDLLNPPPSVTGRQFDLVFSFGALHHTGDTRRALSNLAPLAANDGLLFLYLYGPRRLTRRVPVEILRVLLSPLPFSAKESLLRVLFPRRDPHQTFDLFSPTINTVHDFRTVRDWLFELGFPEVTPTLNHSELFIRASRTTALPFRPLPTRPYWFERYHVGRAP